VIAVRQ
jgi:hypothetical protein